MTILLESGRLVSLIRVSDKGDSGERLDSVGYTAERFSFSTDHKGDRVAGLVQLVGHADRTLAGRASLAAGISPLIWVAASNSVARSVPPKFMRVSGSKIRPVRRNVDVVRSRRHIVWRQ